MGRYVLCLLVAGCSAAPGSELVIERVDPASAPNTVAVPLRVEGTGFHLPLTSDLDHGSTVVGDMAVTVGDLPLEAAVWRGEQLIEGSVPAGLAPGTYDVTVRLGDRSGVLAGGYVVTGAADPVDRCVRELTAAGEQATEGHTCALRPSGEVLCWGANPYGQLGDGTMSDQLSPTPVAGVTTAVQVDASSHHTCVVTTTRDVACWGRNLNYQLGDGTQIDRTSPVRVLGMTDAVQVSAGHHHTCVRKLDRSVWCWGENVNGSVGDGSFVEQRAPVELSLTDVIEISAGEDHTCARRSGGDVWCWGLNNFGQLGDGTTQNRGAPTVVTGLVAKGLAGGFRHTCALTGAGDVSCWGQNSSGQLGIGSLTDSYVPVGVTVGATVVEVGAGDDHSCARVDDGSVRCWGSNQFGQLGNGSLQPVHTSPVTVSLASASTQLGPGGVHTCVRMANGTIECWGRNLYGQLGTGAQNDSNVPVASEFVCN